MTNSTAVPLLTAADVSGTLTGRLAKEYDRHVAASTGEKLTAAELQAHARAALALRTWLMSRLDRDGYERVVTALRAGVSPEQAADSLGWPPGGLRMCILAWQADLRREGRLDEAEAYVVASLAGIRTMSAGPLP